VITDDSSVLPTFGGNGKGKSSNLANNLGKGSSMVVAEQPGDVLEDEPPASVSLSESNNPSCLIEQTAPGQRTVVVLHALLISSDRDIRAREPVHHEIDPPQRLQCRSVDPTHIPEIGNLGEAVSQE
jgi:hypothetical protein